MVMGLCKTGVCNRLGIFAEQIAYLFHLANTRVLEVAPGLAVQLNE